MERVHNDGRLSSGILFAVGILIPPLARWRPGLGSIAAFWMSYVVTRPLGASFDRTPAVIGFDHEAERELEAE